MNAQSPQDSDVYVTGPSGSPDFFNNCGAKFASSDYTLHAPYGTTVVDAPFTSIAPTAWHDDFHETPLLSHVSRVLLAKTRNGHIVKIELKPEQQSIQGRFLVAEGGRFADNAPAPSTFEQQQTGSSGTAPARLNASIVYRDPPTATYGTLHALVTVVPWPQSVPFFQTYTVVGVAVSPQPYAQPSSSMRIDGTTAKVDPRSGLLQGVKPGRAMLRAQIGPPLARAISMPVVTYGALILECGGGVHFGTDGTYQSADIASSDLYISAEPDTFTCQEEPHIYFPGGGVLLSNGNDSWRSIAGGAYRGPQFPDVTSAQWREAMSSFDMDQYRHLTAPCMIPTSPGVERAEYGCTTMSAHVLLFRTRDGRYVKWLLTNGSGLYVLAGPYQVL